MPYIAMKLQGENAAIDDYGRSVKVKLPEGSIGFMLVFKTKKAARKFYGDRIGLTEVEISNMRTE